MNQRINRYQKEVNLDYERCIGCLEHDYVIAGITAQVRLHYLKFDGNGRPMVNLLAKTLFSYIIDYCIATTNRPSELSAKQAVKLTSEARALFRHPDLSDGRSDSTGEAGEILLYFLMESVLRAPQMVCKMELKTNPNDEIKGSDGIHARYDANDDIVDFYFGESKLYQKRADAIADAMASINNFHDSGTYQHELSMVTKHYKYANDKTKSEIASLIVNGEMGEGARLNHACLIGYDFNAFSKLEGNSRDELFKSFIDQFTKDGEGLVNLLQKRFDEFPKKYICFEVFLLPFPSVEDFRNAFNNALD